MRMMAKADSLRLIWSPEAESDLFDIWDFASLANKVDHAEGVLREIERAADLLSRWPEFGRARDTLRAGIRSLHVNRHTIFYRVKDNAVQIVRVLDERRDIETTFNDHEGFRA
jgi:toxin ParE1/3/4